MRLSALTVGLFALTLAAHTVPLFAFEEVYFERSARLRAVNRPWNGPYYYIPWDHQPVALVVPPTAEYQTNYGWGVSGRRVTRIDHQFQRPYPGPYTGRQRGVDTGFRGRAQYPSDTNQFGVYYIRGPW